MGLDVRFSGDAGAVDEHVEPPPAFDDLEHGGLHRGFVGDIDAQTFDVGAKLLLQGRERLGIDVKDDDERAF